MLARAGELQLLAEQVATERLHLRRLRERLTLCRRDISKLIEAAVEEGASGNWEMVTTHFRTPVTAATEAATALSEMEMLREEIVNHLEMQLKTNNMNANPFQNDRTYRLQIPNLLLNLNLPSKKRRAEIRKLAKQPRKRR